MASQANDRRDPGAAPIRGMLRVCGEHLAFAIGFSALVNIAYLAPTLYMLQVYDRAIPSGSRPTLAFLTLALALTLVFLTYMDRVRARLLASASAHLDRTYAARLYRQAMAAPAAGQPRLNQVVRDFDTIRAALTGPAAVALFDTPWIPIYLVVCFIVHPLIGWLAAIGAVVLLTLAVLNEQATRDLSRRAGEVSSAAFAAQEAAGASSDVVRALGMTEAFVAQFESARLEAARAQLQGARATARIGGAMRFLRLFLQSAALGAGAWLAIEKQISAGAVFACSMLASRALGPLDQIVSNWRGLSAAITAYDSLKMALAAPEQPQPPTALPDPAPRLAVIQAGVRAPGRDRMLLAGVGFEVSGGALVGVVGASGAGKSTLLQALANVRPLDQGEIRLDGARYPDWEPGRLGRLIGYLPQDFALFPGSIKDNISRFDRWIGVDPATVDGKAIEAARAAGVHDLILTLPQGYDTQIGLRGRGLSAGQQQRIALARALYGDPVVYVLDEPNSAADAEAEAALLAVLQRLKSAGRLAVLAVHKLSMLAAVDILVVLKDGRVEKAGPRDEVLAALRAAEPPRAATLAASPS
ncbi:type I secretion system permease/ATPase [Caulobacter sp. KR2-114]|uniref:type I secretion system permease/ATPase n=1 Tax=Caulobacter sp. KR2-114 TaxID=3400912 RepID=UPI003BFAEDBD